MLGSCGAWPEPGRACSGFLLECDGFRVVLDLGYGAASRLFEHCPSGEVDAVVVTHEHPDHCVDVSALARARYYRGSGRVPLYCPPGVVDVLERLEPRPGQAELYEVHELSGTARLGPFRLDAVPLPHHVSNVGVRLDTGELSVAYTGDCGPSDALAKLGAGVDLFVVEATLQGPPPDEAPRHLLTAREAGAWAARARARRLLLTHFWPGSERAVSLAEARETFPGEVRTAEEGQVLRVPS